MSSNVSHGFTGRTVLKKISGSGAIANGTEIIIPHFNADFINPSNDRYEAMVNKSNFLVNLTRGKRTPAVAIQTAAKSTWFTPNWLNSLIKTVDANAETDLLAIKGVEESRTEKYGGARCGRLSISHNAAGGPLGVEMDFIAADPADTTVFTDDTTPVSADPGEVLGPASIDYGASATADVVQGWQLNLMRPQAYEFFSNRSYNPSGVATGQFGGTFAIDQSRKAAIVPSTTVTIRIYTGAPGSQTLHATIVLKLNTDRPVRRYNVGMGVDRTEYTLIDVAGGDPAVIS